MSSQKSEANFTESTTALQNEIQRLEENNYKLETDIRNLGKTKRYNDKEIARLKDQLIEMYDGAKK